MKIHELNPGEVFKLESDNPLLQNTLFLKTNDKAINLNSWLTVYIDGEKPCVKVGILKLEKTDETP